MAEKNYNEELCEQVRQGKLAIENTGTEKELEDLLSYIFPTDDWAIPEDRFFFADFKNKRFHTNSNISTLPHRPVSDFFLPTPPDKVEGGKEGVDEEAKALVEMFSDVFKNIGSIGVPAVLGRISAECHCDLMISKLSELLNTGLHNDFGIMDERKHYTDLKASINKL